MSAMRVMCFAIGQAVATFSTGIASSGSARNSEAECIVQINERTAAFVAEDWPALERLADRYLRTCKEVLPSENYAGAFENVATANIEMGRVSKALAASDSCINTSYSNCGCHLIRIEALARLKRRPEARVALEKAERLIDHVVELTESELKSSKTELERNLMQARLRALKSQKEKALALRERYFPE